MATTMAREARTDERLDDLNKRVDDGFKEMREEFRAGRAELRANHAETNQQFAALYRLIVQMFASMMLGLLGIVATVLLHG